jgi:putative SOS response-associated peptidase YedK
MSQTTRYSDREYFAHRTASGDIGMSVNFVAPVYRRRHVVMSDEESAQRWLGENGLPKSEAKKLLDAVLRNDGELADRTIQTTRVTRLAKENSKGYQKLRAVVSG